MLSWTYHSCTLLGKMIMNFDKQLYESGLTAQGSYDKMDQYDQEAIIRFAEIIVDDCVEIIVNECIRKIENIAESSNDPHPIYRVAVELLEHFGVEE